MRILRLRLTNLNSLRGEISMDFEQPPLANSGLFAITGPTGAGKTTLLDAITLALYGRVARYGKDPSPDSVMSRHTGECSAEVEFACSSGNFRSVWQLQRARKKSDGRLQQAKRRVIALPAEDIVAESIKDADAKILELTGLDYDRFLRSVLLAQGEFAAFLKAGSKERTELLQEVTGTEIYRDISQCAHRVCAEADQAHATLLRENQAVTVLDPDERLRHQTALDDGTRRVDELSAILPALRKRIADATRWLEIEKDGQQLSADQAAYDRDRQEAAPALAQLEAHEKGAPCIADLSALGRLTSDQKNDTAALTALETTLSDLTERLHVADTAAGQAKAALADESERQIKLRVIWDEVAEMDKALATATETLRQVTTQHASLEKTDANIQKSLTTEQSSLAEHIRARNNAQAWLADHAIDANLSAQLQEIQGVFTRWSVAEEAAAETAQTFSRQQKEIAQLNADQIALNEKLPPLQHDLAEKQAAEKSALQTLEKIRGQLSLSEIETHRDQARERSRSLENLVTDAAAVRALAATLSERRKEAAETSANVLRLADDCKSLQQRRDEIATLLAAQRDRLHLAEKVQSLESHRAALQKYQPCPLCGALDHPYVNGTELPSAELHAIRQEVAEAESGQKESQRHLTEAEKKHAAFLAAQKRLVAECEKLAAEHSLRVAAWKTAATPCALADQLENEPALAEALAKAHAEAGKRATQMIAARDAEHALQTARDAQRKAEAKLQDAQNDAKQQTALTAQARDQLTALEAAVARHAQKNAVEKNAFETCVANHATAPNDITAAQALCGTLKIRAQTYTKHQAEHQTHHAQVEKTQAKCESLSQQLVEARTNLGESRDKVAAAKIAFDNQTRIRRGKFGERSVADAQREAELTREKMHDRAEATRDNAEKIRKTHTASTQEKTRLTQALASRKIECDAIAARLHIAITASGFSDEKSLRAALLSPSEATALAQRRKQLDEWRVALAVRDKALADQRAKLPASAAEDAPNLPALQAHQLATEKDLGTAQAQLGATREILKNDDAQRTRQAAFSGQIEAAQRDFVRWDKLRALIGSADGSLFARFAQGLTLERLTVLANRHLALLDPRYSIRRVSGTGVDDLELEIVDHYQADAVRPMRSLSGGESFLASLALALGLSELASGRTSIESLFIDEGFGSLDADTLETAMSALENLQAKGKTIGVISHVPAMQERIPAQIKVTKESGGCSCVTITS